MPLSRRGLLGLAWFAVCAGSLHAAAPPGAEAEAKDLFEARIRPVLVKHCYACHAAEAKKIEGGLRLDTPEGLARGGEGGPIVVAGRPDKSRLLAALRWEELEMPPSGKLPAEVVADFARWIEGGALDPRKPGGSPATSPRPTIDAARAKNHWAFQPVVRPAVPNGGPAGWVATPLDAFVAARLAAAGLAPGPHADRRTLLRRASFDLLGLPPSPEEMDAFLQDDSPDAWERVIDRLLASPHYGERWARHWLDLARYADTKDGVLMFGDDRLRPYAYTYRDYVIRAFHEDTPFDRFIAEQLAADQLEPPVEPWRRAAMGFLTVGRIFDNNPPDVVDDQIDVVSRGLLGLTLSCARCHDHKYDPLTQADYYGLYGVFANSEAPLESPLAAPEAEVVGAEKFESQAGPLRKRLADHIDAEFQKQTETARRRAGDYLHKIAAEKFDPLEATVFFLSLSPDDLRPHITQRWRRFLERRSAADDPVFGPWNVLLAVEDGPQFAERTAPLLARLRAAPAGTAAGQVNPLVREALGNGAWNSRSDVARRYGELLLAAYDRWKRDPAALAPADSQLAEILVGPENPISFPRSQTYLYMARVERTTFHDLKKQLDRLAATTPGAPPRAMTLVDAPEIEEPRIFLRGNPAQPGDRVPRRFPRALSAAEAGPFSHGAGRLDLAAAITDPRNPLTARVWMNRVWMHHFGEPLVATPSDFGLRSEPPVQAALLDWLAAEFMEPSVGPAGPAWSLKRIHRLILRSSVWRQAAAERANCRRIDPDNRLLWRAGRRRLELEAMRDSLLAASGRLDRALYGRPLRLTHDPQLSRRTIYGLVDRQDLPNLYRVFDFASPDQSAERRPLTTTPQQALFGLNAPFVQTQAQSLAAHAELAREETVSGKLVALYRRVLQRAPTDAERSLAERFLAAAAADPQPGVALPLSPWEQLAQALLLSNEAMFVD